MTLLSTRAVCIRSASLFTILLCAIAPIAAQPTEQHILAAFGGSENSASQITMIYKEFVMRDAPAGTYATIAFTGGYVGLADFTSPEGPHVNFSVWDADESAPAYLVESSTLGTPDNHRFSHEGHGFHSELDYPWQLGVRYKVLVKLERRGPDTLWSAWFNEAEAEDWHLVGRIYSPNDSRYLSLGGFVEHVGSENPDSLRRAGFDPGWAYDSSIGWVASTAINYSNKDATASNAAQVDDHTVDVMIQRGLTSDWGSAHSFSVTPRRSAPPEDPDLGSNRSESFVAPGGADIADHTSGWRWQDSWVTSSGQAVIASSGLSFGPALRGKGLAVTNAVAGVGVVGKHERTMLEPVSLNASNPDAWVTMLLDLTGAAIGNRTALELRQNGTTVLSFGKGTNKNLGFGTSTWIEALDASGLKPAYNDLALLVLHLSFDGSNTAVELFVDQSPTSTDIRDPRTFRFKAQATLSGALAFESVGLDFSKGGTQLSVADEITIGSKYPYDGENVVDGFVAGSGDDIELHTSGVRWSDGWVSELGQAAIAPIGLSFGANVPGRGLAATNEVAGSGVVGRHTRYFIEPIHVDESTPAQWVTMLVDLNGAMIGNKSVLELRNGGSTILAMGKGTNQHMGMDVGGWINAVDTSGLKAAHNSRTLFVLNLFFDGANTNVALYADQATTADTERPETFRYRATATLSGTVSIDNVRLNFTKGDTQLSVVDEITIGPDYPYAGDEIGEPFVAASGADISAHRSGGPVWNGSWITDFGAATIASAGLSFGAALPGTGLSATNVVSGVGVAGRHVRKLADPVTVDASQPECWVTMLIDLNGAATGNRSVLELRDGGTKVTSIGKHTNQKMGFDVDGWINAINSSGQTASTDSLTLLVLHLSFDGTDTQATIYADQNPAVTDISDPSNFAYSASATVDGPATFDRVLLDFTRGSTQHSVVDEIRIERSYPY